MRDERVTLFQKSPLGENQMTNRGIAASSSGLAVAPFAVVALCDGHRHQLEPLIDVHKFVC